MITIILLFFLIIKNVTQKNTLNEKTIHSKNSSNHAPIN